MSKIFRVMVLAALAVVVGSFPAGAAQLCNDFGDCKSGYTCQKEFFEEAGHCVRISDLNRSSSIVKRLFCENSLDCPLGDFCSIRPGHKTGSCVGGFSPIATIFCEKSLDCPLGEVCKIMPGKYAGHCASP